MLPVRVNFLSSLWSEFYIKYTMWENPKHETEENMNGKCCICNGRKNICCMQFQSTTLSQATQNKRTFRICHMECVFCKIKYMGKSEKQKKKRKYEWQMSHMRQQENDMLHACPGHYIFHKLQRQKKLLKTYLTLPIRANFLSFLQSMFM